MHITFAGAAGTVTGSRYLVEAAGQRVLVDCGLFQGIKSLRERNWTPPSFAPSSLDAVILTHAHIDHTGYLPRLIEDGYRNRVSCTTATRDLLGILLPDSGYLQEEEARLANRHGYAQHHPALPLYTRSSAERSLSQLEARPFDTTFELAPGIQARFTWAGHILGSACVTLSAEGKTISFSGDVGRPVDPILKPPEALPACDTLVVESTYGDRRHPVEDVHKALANVVHEACAAGGTLVIPAFAVGRAQHLLHILGGLQTEGAIPKIPIFLDSPMAINATEIFLRYRDQHRLDDGEVARMSQIAKYTRTPEESKEIDADDAPKIVISASGMATGGRVLHHLRRFLPDARNTVLLVGFQASGTRGRLLLDRADELKIHGQYVRVRARIRQVEGLSAHADWSEISAWLGRSKVSPSRVFVTHGEPGPADNMRRVLRDAYGWNVSVPAMDQRFQLDD